MPRLYEKTGAVPPAPRKTMDFRFSKHAEFEMALRKINKDLVQSVLAKPEQVVAEIGGKKIYQSKVEFPNKKTYLLRVIINEASNPAVVITAYRTSKIEKYWRVK